MPLLAMRMVRRRVVCLLLFDVVHNMLKGDFRGILPTPIRQRYTNRLFRFQPWNVMASGASVLTDRSPSHIEQPMTFISRTKQFDLGPLKRGGKLRWYPLPQINFSPFFCKRTFEIIHRQGVQNF